MKKLRLTVVTKHLKTLLIGGLGISVLVLSSNQTSLQNELEEQQIQLISSLEENYNLKSQLSTQSKKLKTLEDKEQSHQDELEQEKAKTKDTEEKLKNKEKELEDIKNKHQKIEKDLQELQAKYTEVESNFQNYKNQNDSFIELGKQAQTAQIDQQASAPASTQQHGFAQTPVVTASAYYRNCSEARAAGAAPVRAGEPGYGRHLDRDGDGIGCE